MIVVTHNMEYHLEESIRVLSKGTYLHKYRSSKSYYRRKFVISMKDKYITYDGSRKLSCAHTFCKIDFADIEDVRRGWKTDLFNTLENKVRNKKRVSLSLDKRPKVQESLCFSIILTDYSTFDLIAETEQVAEHWIQFLSFIVASNKNAEKEREKDYWLTEQFKKADVSKNGNLEFSECLLLLKRLNFSVDKKEARYLFNEANVCKIPADGKQVLDPDEFLSFYHSLIKRPDLEHLFRKYSGTTLNVMGPEDLLRFLKHEQNMEINLEQCQSMIEVYQPNEDNLLGYLSLQGFEELLMSPEFNIFRKDHVEIYQDMNRPLSHYFIASSHNTYLISDQLVGLSSVEGYVRALQKGCRCVELDCWNGTDDEPIVYHGHTLTSKILFRDVLDVIKLYAFVSSKYPVILSIENHCNDKYQKKMAEHLVRVFGDSLYTTQVSEDMEKLPSPEELKNKIIVKAKKIKIQEEDATPLDEEESEEDEEEKNSKETLKEPEEVAEELSDLVNLCQSTKFKSFENSIKTGKCHQISSFSEAKACTLAKKKIASFILHNEKQLSRVYPSGVRTDSSNYDPIPLWNAGCQIVALNYQTSNKSMRINDAMFKENGGCGYILKSEFMRKNTKHNYKEILKSMKKVLTVTVISGQHIPKPGLATDGEIVDPYVRVTVRGLNKEERKTKHIKNNGFNPVWNEVFELNVDCPDTSIVEFIVKDNSTTKVNEVLGVYMLPFRNISEGYRVVRLEDFEGNQIPMATLFVHLKIFEDEYMK